MPRFWCDYCAVHLTHDSFKGRKQHMYGWKHRENVKQYYAQFLRENEPGFDPVMPMPGGGGMPKQNISAPAPRGMPGMMPPRGMMMPPPGMFGRGPPPGMYGQGPP